MRRNPLYSALLESVLRQRQVVNVTFPYSSVHKSRLCDSFAKTLPTTQPMWNLIILLRTPHTCGSPAIADTDMHEQHPV